MVKDAVHFIAKTPGCHACAISANNAREPHCRATGPCGPCSELYYDFQPELGTAGASLEDDSRFIEFYNLVFMESNRGPDGSLKPLENRNIDTGMGLERVAQVRWPLRLMQRQCLTASCTPICHVNCNCNCKLPDKAEPHTFPCADPAAGTQQL